MKENFIKANKATNEIVIKFDIAIKRSILSIKKPLQNNDGIGKDEVIGIALALIVAAFIIFPGVRSFATTLMSNLDSWYENSIKSNIFETK